MTGLPGPAFKATYEELRARYEPLVAALKPVAVDPHVRPSVVWGYSRADLDMDTYARVWHFIGHGCPLVLQGTAYEMTP